MQREKTVKPQTEKADKAAVIKRLKSYLKQGKESKKGGQKA